MFYCDECADKKTWPKGLMRSRGNCEVCGETRECSDAPSKLLPGPSRAERAGRSRGWPVMPRLYPRLR